MGNTIPHPAQFRPHKQTRSKLDTIEINEKVVTSWAAPPFQRPLKSNRKVEELAVTISQDGGVVPGTITLGICMGKTYLLDGQHRIAAWRMSGIGIGYCDVRVHFVDTMAEMGREFVDLNSQIVRFNPDDILRGLTPSTPALQQIVQRCPFVGYDQVRRKVERGPVVSMSMVLRAWVGSAQPVPTMGESAPRLIAAGQPDEESTKHLCEFLDTAFQAWGRDFAYWKLWGTLNLILCMWIYRNVVLAKPVGRATQIAKLDFKRCLMALSADGDYLDWLVGRHNPQRDRSPCYGKIKRLFVARLTQQVPGAKVLLPAPAWSSH